MREAWLNQTCRQPNTDILHPASLVKADAANQTAPKQTSAPTNHDRTDRRVGGASTEKLRGSMAAGGGVVKHILLVRFKEEVTPERLDQLIRGYAALVDAVPSMKAFHW